MICTNEIANTSIKQEITPTIQLNSATTLGLAIIGAATILSLAHMAMHNGYEAHAAINSDGLDVSISKANCPIEE